MSLVSGKRDSTTRRYAPRFQVDVANWYQGFHKAGCPCCRAASEAEDRYLRWFFIESYYSGETLGRLAHDRFCRRHTAELAAERNDRLSATFQFLTQAEYILLDGFRRTVAREGHGILGPYRRRRLPPEVQAIAQADGCPACGAGRTAVAVEVLYAIAFLATAEGRETFQAHSEGLCRPHLWLVLDEAPAETADWLAAETAQRLRDFLDEFDLFFHRLDYRFQHETKGSEQTAWQRALRYFWGHIEPASETPDRPHGSRDD